MILWETDWRDPVGAFAPFAGVAHAHLLHGGDRSAMAEWSIIAAFPSSVIASKDAGGNPFASIDEALRERRRARGDLPADIPFASGALGFVGYEAAQAFEPSLSLSPSPFSFPDMTLGFYDAAALFSRTKREAFIAGREESACRRLRDALGTGAPPAQGDACFGPVTSNFTQETYCAAVAEIIEDILDGEFYQVNLSQQLRCESPFPVDAYGLYRRLTARSDAQFGALLQYDAGSIISNSPERFFRIEDGAFGGRRIVAEPIKGTRRRGASAESDAALARELMADPKDRAENVMIADLLRNDLSLLCREGTIREEAICELMSLTNVHHLVSRISGVLNDDKSIAEIFAALFPCGSVTGAPKIAAMHAISRIERVGRGPYCGAIGYIDDTGNADFAVAIRTMMIEGNHVVLPVGGGVTLRSNPQDEYDETMTKARGALTALGDPAFEERLA